MSVREKAREIRAEGEAERGRFEATGAPLRSYEYWLQRSKTRHAIEVRHGLKKENFCHFWRVVAIWSPLMKLGKALNAALDSRAVQVGLGLLLLAAIVFVSIISPTVLEAVLVIGGTFLGIAVVFGVLFGIHQALEKARPGEGDDLMTLGLFAVAGTVAAGLLVWGIVEAFLAFGLTLLWWALGIAAGVGVLIAIVLGLGTLAGYFRARKNARLARENEVDPDKWDYEQVAYPEEEEPKEPGAFRLWLGRTLTSIGDYLILIGQIVRVKKWKICPLVEIDTTPKAEV
jgi:hypothetical protein